MTSIFAPFFNSSADGTLMMSLVTGCEDTTPAPGKGGGVVGGLIETSSISKMSAAPGGISRPVPRSP